MAIFKRDPLSLNICAIGAFKIDTTVALQGYSGTNVSALHIDCHSNGMSDVNESHTCFKHYRGSMYKDMCRCFNPHLSYTFKFLSASLILNFEIHIKFTLSVGLEI